MMLCDLHEQSVLNPTKSMEKWKRHKGHEKFLRYQVYLYLVSTHVSALALQV